MSQITDRNGHSIFFYYGADSHNNTVLFSIADDNGKTLLAINGNQSISDCYGRTVWYQSATFGDYSYPELTSVSQVVSTSASPPFASRYVYNYANVPSGDAAEVVPFLHTITVPSPTGSGTSTATIWYLNEPGDGVKTNPYYSAVTGSGPYVSAIVDSNGNTTTMKTINGQNQGQVQVTDASGKVLRTSSYGFDFQMRMTSLTDYNQKTTQTMSYDDPNYGFEPSSITDGNNRSWLYTWDRYGHLLTKKPPASGVRQSATTTYTYDTTYFWMGELTRIVTGRKQATTIGYDHTKGYTQTVNGPLYLGSYIKYLTGPLPGVPSAANYASSVFTFDGWGNLTSLITPGNSATYTNPADPSTDQGITTTFSYAQPEAIGQPLKVTRNFGSAANPRYVDVARFSYDTFGRRSSVVDALKHLTSYTYNLADQPLQVTRPATQQTGTGQSYTAYSYQYVGGPLAALTAYDESNNVVRQVSYQYGSEGETLAVGGSTEPAQYGYDGLYRTVALADGNGHGTHYYFNLNGYLDSVTYPGYTGPAYPNVSGPDSVRYLAYDGDGNPLRRIDGNGAETDYTYNDPENLLTNIHYPGGQLADVSYVYDIYGRVASMTDGTGATNYEGASLPGYDDLDNPLAVQTVYTGGPTQTIGYSYFNDGSRRTMTVPGRSYSYTYDAVGRFTNLTNGIGESTAWAYQDNNWPSVQTDSNGLKTFPSYNALGQLTDLQNIANGSIVSEFGDPTHGRPITHDAVGNTLSVTTFTSSENYATANYAYDGRDQITQENSTRIGGFASAFAYDTAGNPTLLRGVPSRYNADNQAVSPVSNNPAFASDGNGNPGAARGRALTFDPENRLTAAADQAGGISTALAVGPDNLLRLLNTNRDSSMSLLNVSLASNGGSNVTSTLGPYGPFPGDWNCLGIAVGPDNLTRVLWANAGGIAQVWKVNADGSYSATPGYGPFPGWACVGLSVGPDNLTRLLWNRADGMMSIWTLNPDGSHPTAPGYGPFPGWTCTGIATGPDGRTRALWNRTDGMMSVWIINTDGSHAAVPGYGPFPGDWSCTNVAVGPDNLTRVLWTSAAGIAQVWKINADGSYSATPGYGPFPGNWTCTSLAVEPDGLPCVLWTSVSGIAQAWRIKADGSYSASAGYGPYGGAVSGTGQTSAYRGDGLRAWKQTDAGARTYYLYDGGQPVAELGGSGNVAAENMFGAWGLVSRSTPSAGTAFYAFDERGNVAQRTNGSGALLSTDVYDAFGTKRAGPADVWGFGGQAGYYTDPETGLVLCTRRFYDPQQGRFLTRDPIGYAGGINLYSYVGNNPVNGMDPDGTDDIDNTIMVTLTGVGALGGGILGAGGGGVAGFGIGAIPGAIVGAGVGGAAGAASGVIAVGMRHALLGLMSGHGGGGIETGTSYATKAPLPPIITERDPTKNPLTGKDPADVVPGKALPSDWITEPGREPGTVRYRPPGYQGPQVLKEPGDPNATGSDPVHNGPYCKISPGNGKPFRIPLRGNPVHGPGF